MLRLRPYKPGDAETIISWCKDEVSFRRWTSDRYDRYPITAVDMNHKYIDLNGDCAEPDNFYPMTACDENGPVGHLILRYTDGEKKCIRLGFVIVDDARRGMGYGKEMICLAQRFAFDIFKAERVTLGVFENNLPAYCCYRAAGFRQVEETSVCVVNGEAWKIVEFEMMKEDFASAEATKGLSVTQHR